MRGRAVTRLVRLTLALVASACGERRSGPTAPSRSHRPSAIAIASIAPPRSMTVSRVDLILGGDEARAAACELPATTHLMRATLVQDPNQRAHSQDFGSVYTFARP